MDIWIDMFFDFFEWQSTSRWLVIQGWCHLQDPLGALICAFGLLSAGGVLMFIEPLHAPWTTWVFYECLEGWWVAFTVNGYGMVMGKGQGADRSFCRHEAMDNPGTVQLAPLHRPQVHWHLYTFPWEMQNAQWQEHCGRFNQEQEMQSMPFVWIYVWAGAESCGLAGCTIPAMMAL